MAEEYAIQVKNITKHFKVYFDKGSQLKEKILFKNRNRYESRSVINDISFNVKKGEAIGLIGHNGCGKSTTLKLLAKIIYPDSGSIKINGRVSSLIELGAGFHPDMSGRENIYTNAAIFGLTKKEIDKRLKEIIRFSELEEFIDNPVRTYSSGMYMRLAFSVAINVDAEVLLIDEILAVGDVNFQQKCFEKLKEIKRNGTTIVIVSHSLGQIEQICERTIWIEGGKIKEEGIPKYVHEDYLHSMEQGRQQRIEKERLEKEKDKKEEKVQEVVNKQEVAETHVQKEENKSEENRMPDFCTSKAVRMGNKKVEFTNVEILSAEGFEQYSFKTGDKLDIVISYKSNISNLKGNVGIGFFRDDGIYCFGTNIDIERDKLIDLKETGKIKISINNLPLMYGKYNLDVAIHSKDSTEIYDDIRNAKEIQIFRYKRDDGLVRIDTEWYSDEAQL